MEWISNSDLFHWKHLLKLFHTSEREAISERYYQILIL